MTYEIHESGRVVGSIIAAESGIELSANEVGQMVTGKGSDGVLNLPI